jgi:hypothetical protein
VKLVKPGGETAVAGLRRFVFVGPMVLAMPCALLDACARAAAGVPSMPVSSVGSVGPLQRAAPRPNAKPARQEPSAQSSLFEQAQASFAARAARHGGPMHKA